MTHTTSRELEVVSVVDALADDLERRVLGGEFAPGEHLREVELAEEYRVGRHTLRAAFDGLIRRGVLERARNRGVFVRVLTAQDIPDIYELRTALEVQAFRTLAARRTVPPEATEALARLRSLKARSPRHEVVAADLAFHRAIVAGTGNRCLVRAHEDLHSETLLSLSQLVTRYASVRQLADEHADLLALIESGRPAKAEAAIRDHLERATAWLVEHAAEPEAAAQLV
jgi:DNA-binding GntR family transcriptional regulator